MLLLLLFTTTSNTAWSVSLQWNSAYSLWYRYSRSVAVLDSTSSRRFVFGCIHRSTYIFFFSLHLALMMLSMHCSTVNSFPWRACGGPAARPTSAANKSNAQNVTNLWCYVITIYDLKDYHLSSTNKSANCSSVLESTYQILFAEKTLKFSNILGALWSLKAKNSFFANLLSKAL